jgi:hypothetical protein
MKRILLALAMLALLVPALRQAEAADVSIDFFYNNLEGSGQWVEVADYGYCWQPSVAVSNRNWRPYSDGYWAYTDVGWTWVSYEDFGWATYHYGRWSHLQDHGWVWVPGYEWGPAWVSWRTGGDQIGWAPLPPRREVVYEGRPITGQVDIEFGIGPMYYNFVDVRYIGEPVLRDRIYEPSRNVTFINNTVNVTNITYNNSVVYNYGPDYRTVNSYSARPIQRLRLQRQTAAAGQLGTMTKVQGDALVVAAPPKLQRPAKPIAPKAVKAKIDQPKIDTGWDGAGDQQAQAQLKHKMQTENAKNVSPPTAQPNGGNGAAHSGAAASPVTAASPATPASPATGSEAASGSAATAASPATPASPATAKGQAKGQGKGRHGEHGQPAGSPAANTPADSTANGADNAQPSAAPVAPNGGKKQKRNRGNEQPPNAAPAASAAPGPNGTATIAPEATQPANKHKGQRARDLASPPPVAPTDTVAPHRENGGRGNGKGAKRTPDVVPPPAATPARGPERGPVPAAPGVQRRGGPAPVTPVAPEAGQERPAKGKGKKKGAEESPSPSPAG